MELIESAMKLLEEKGWAVFFAFICLCETVWLLKLLVWDRRQLLKELEKEREHKVQELEKERERTMALAGILERRNQMDVQLMSQMVKVEESVKADQKIQSEFLTYLKTKDLFYRRMGDVPPT